MVFTVAKGKRTKGKTKRISFGLGAFGRKKRRSSRRYSPSLVKVLKVLGAVCAFGAVGVGFVLAVGAGFGLLDKYVKRAVPASGKIGSLELVNVPVWVNEGLKEKIYAAATAYGEDLRLDGDAAQSVQHNMETLIAWLGDVKVRTTHEKIVVEADYRKPVALVKRGLQKFYVDEDLVVLDYLPMPDLPIVRVAGLSPMARVPQPGEVWRRDDLAAAVAILVRLDRMDRLVTRDKPLLFEIDSIDVSNHDGRQNKRFPHIVLYTKDNTEIIWGAEIGAWQRHLESTDEQKLAKLYDYYKKHGPLSGGVKYINLRDPRDNVPLPIDRF